MTKLTGRLAYDGFLMVKRYSREVKVSTVDVKRSKNLCHHPPLHFRFDAEQNIMNGFVGRNCRIVGFGVHTIEPEEAAQAIFWLKLPPK
jgi:hypothetical protein